MPTSAYPNALDDIREDFAGGTLTKGAHAEHHDLLASALKKTQAELGVNPSGTSVDVATLLAPLSGVTFNVKDPQFAGGAKGDWNGTTGTNDTAAIQAAFDASESRWRYMPDGAYWVPTGTLNGRNGLHVRGDGPDRTKIVFGDAVGAAATCFSFAGAILDISSALAADTVIGSDQIVVSNASLFTVGQWAIISDSYNIPTSPAGANNAVWISRIRSINTGTNTLTMVERCPAVIYAAQTGLVKAASADLWNGIVLQDLTLSVYYTGANPVNRQNLLQIQNAFRPVCRNVKVENTTTGLWAYQCREPQYIDCDADNIRDIQANVDAGTTTAVAFIFDLCTKGIVQNPKTRKTGFPGRFTRSPHCHVVGGQLSGAGEDIKGRGWKFEFFSNFCKGSGLKIDNHSYMGFYIADSAYCSVEAEITDITGTVTPHGRGLVISGYDPNNTAHHNRVDLQVVYANGSAVFTDGGGFNTIRVQADKCAQAYDTPIVDLSSSNNEVYATGDGWGLTTTGLVRIASLKSGNRVATHGNNGGSRNLVISSGTGNTIIVPVNTNGEGIAPSSSDYVVIRPRVVNVTFGAAPAINATLGTAFFVDMNAATAPTLATPTNPFDGARIRVWFKSSTPTHGIISASAAYALIGGGTQIWAAGVILNGNRRWIDFEYRQPDNKWYEISRATADST